MSKFFVSRLQTIGWEGAPHAINEQRTFTDGQVIFARGKAKRGRQKRADYPIAIVEAKAAYKSATDGLQQAKDLRYNYHSLSGYSGAISAGARSWSQRRRSAGGDPVTPISSAVASVACS